MKKRILKIAALVAALAMLMTMFACGSSKITIRNESFWELNECYVSPSTESTWGADQFNGRALEINKNTTVPFEQDGTYDIRFIDSDGDAWEFYGVDLAEGCKVTVSSWGSMTVTISGNNYSYSGSLN